MAREYKRKIKERFMKGKMESDWEKERKKYYKERGMK